LQHSNCQYPQKKSQSRLVMLKKQSVCSGFSLVELIVTVIIIGILASVTIGGITSYVPNYRLDSAAQQLRGDMQMCKMAAVRNSTQCYMEFVESGGGGSGKYKACLSKDTSCSGDKIIRGENLDNEDYDGVELKDAGFSSGDPEVIFDGRGLPNWNGSVMLKTDQGKNRTITVSKTGRIKIK